MTHPTDERRVRALYARRYPGWIWQAADRHQEGSPEWRCLNDATIWREIDEAAHVGTYDTRTEVKVPKRLLKLLVNFWDNESITKDEGYELEDMLADLEGGKEEG